MGHFHFPGEIANNGYAKVLRGNRGVLWDCASSGLAWGWDHCKFQEKLENDAYLNLGGQAKGIMVFSVSGNCSVHQHGRHDVRGKPRIDLFTVSCLVTCPLTESEAGVDLVMYDTDVLAFSRALSKLHAIAMNLDWFIALFAPAVIGRIGIVLRHSIENGFSYCTVFN